MDFRTTTPSKLAARVRAREISARELTEAALARIEELNPAVNAFVAVDGDRAIREAAAVDDTIARGGEAGPLAGVPIGVKDLDDAAGYPTSHGSPLFADAGPAAVDSPLVARLRAAGCVVVGKTNTPEYGWTSNTDNALFGQTHNPWQLDHSPGGSSGGTAAALASGMVPLATGSDGGGSIRIPASCCGLSGFKPSLGRVPAGGIDPPGWIDFSTKGAMTRRLADLVPLLDVTIGPDPTDLRSLPAPGASWVDLVSAEALPRRVAWSPTLGYAPLDDEVRALCEGALRTLESLGIEVVPVDRVFAVDPLEGWMRLTNVCLLRSMQDYRDDPAWEKVHPVLASLVERAHSVTALEVVDVFDECHRMNLALVELFESADLLVTPTVAGLPPAIAGGGIGLINGEPNANWVRFTYPFNMTRSPAATLCAGLAPGGLPVGLQLVGPQHRDALVLRTAVALEDAIGFSELAPIG
jgi:Asp-tRNA(Asn)/Glu-tRNA(Gln) amidotransferase A subunit family amidase